DLLAAQVAGPGGPAVDVDLAAVVVDARRAAHRLRGVLGAHGVDAVGPYAPPHERGQVGPDRVPLGRGDVPARAVGVDAVPEEDLGAVDVAHAGDDLLVHQQRGDGRTAAADPAVRGGRVRVGAERVGAEAGVHGLLLGVGDEGAGGGSAQVGVAAVTGEAQAHGVGGRRRGGRSEGDLAEQAEVDVDPVGVPGAGVAEAEEEVFAVG